MGFYDSYNFDGLKFFSGLKTSSLNAPCDNFLSIIKQLKSNTPPPESLTVAEIGIGAGATALQVLKLLDECDTYYAFDFEDSIKPFAEDLQARDFGIKCQVVTKSNSRKKFDSYNWNLSNMVFEMRERHEAGIFDAVYLDGAHNLFHDGLAVCLLKELIKDGGYLLLDDLFWSYSKSPSLAKVAINIWTKEQYEDCQVFRVQELFLTNDPNWERLSSPKDEQGLFRKRIKE